MSFLKSLFGGRKPAEDRAPAETGRIEHNGFVIIARPYKVGGEYQTAGLITREIGGVLREHGFVRAERHGTLEAAGDYSLTKGRQIVDQLGERLFD